MCGRHDLTETNVGLCHEYGINAYPSGNDRGPDNQSTLERFFKIGVDGMFPVHPFTALQAVKGVLHTEYLPRINRTIFDLLHPADPMTN